jgi:hypothetical protein
MYQLIQQFARLYAQRKVEYYLAYLYANSKGYAQILRAGWEYNFLFYKGH